LIYISVVTHLKDTIWWVYECYEIYYGQELLDYPIFIGGIEKLERTKDGATSKHNNNKPNSL